MSVGRVRHRTKLLAALAIGFLSLIVLRGAEPVRALPAQAQRFVQYYKAFGASEAKLRPWQRVWFSLAMAGSPTRRSAQGEETKCSMRPEPDTATAIF